MHPGHHALERACTAPTIFLWPSVLSIVFTHASCILPVHAVLPRLEAACCLAALQKGALTPAELCEAMGMAELKNRKWHVQGAIAIKGEGLYEVRWGPTHPAVLTGLPLAAQPHSFCCMGSSSWLCVWPR